MNIQKVASLGLATIMLTSALSATPVLAATNSGFSNCLKTSSWSNPSSGGSHTEDDGSSNPVQAKPISGFPMGWCGTGITATISQKTYTYDGKVKTPSVTHVAVQGKVLAKGKDYTVNYSSGRKNVGTYKITIKFKGNYAKIKPVSTDFKIIPKNTSISSLTPKSKAFTIKLKKNTTQTTGYQIQYSTLSKFSTGSVITLRNTTTSKTIKGLAKKKYYVGVRTYKTVNGTKYYSNWSDAKTVTTK